MAAPEFEWICEIDPPAGADFLHVQGQVAALHTVATSLLVPDNHIGRAAVSSIAVAHEIDRLGVRPIACLNARDRNLLGLRRDLLTGAAYGIERFLFVYGDRPTSGERTGTLTVRSMLEELRRFDQSTARGSRQPLSAGVTTRLTPLPAWKQEADALFVQVSFSLDDLLAWREATTFSGPVYAGVMVLASAAMARKLTADLPEIDIPRRWVDLVESDRSAGVELACELAQSVEASGAFAGVHLVPGVRYREAAARLMASRS